MGIKHLDKSGRIHMVDVSKKEITLRKAVAVGRVYMQSATLRALIEENIPKGDVFATAKIAGIMAAKQTKRLIPMCHDVPLDNVKIDLGYDLEKSCIDIKATVCSRWKTGVEMEALTAVAITGLTIYDMCKAIDKEMVISDITLIKKTGGKSGEYQRLP